MDNDFNVENLTEDQRALVARVGLFFLATRDFAHVVPDELRAEFNAIEQRARDLEPQVIALARRAFRALARLRVTLEQAEFPRGDPEDPEIREVMSRALYHDASDNMMRELWPLRYHLQLVEEPEKESVIDAPDWFVDEQLNAMLLEG